jgi:hypothetical protein
MMVLSADRMDFSPFRLSTWWCDDAAWQMRYINFALSSLFVEFSSVLQQFFRVNLTSCSNCFCLLMFCTVTACFLASVLFALTWTWSLPLGGVGGVNNHPQLFNFAF